MKQSNEPLADSDFCLQYRRETVRIGVFVAISVLSTLCWASTNRVQELIDSGISAYRNRAEGCQGSSALAEPIGTAIDRFSEALEL